MTQAELADQYWAMRWAAWLELWPLWVGMVPVWVVYYLVKAWKENRGSE